MSYKVVIPPEKLLPVMFDLLFNIKVELEAMRNTIGTVYNEKTGEKSFLNLWDDNLKEAERTVGQLIRKHYAGFDVDALVSSVVNKK